MDGPISKIIQILESLAAKNNQPLSTNPNISFKEYIKQVLEWVYDREEAYILALCYLMKIDEKLTTPINSETVHALYFVVSAFDPRNYFETSSSVF
eukprot:c18378_g2_i1.p1 GENE.c18378_g2_i1~~c18378_g2_i1.p1  ORF type:complete len:103 (+),score=16.70 c18378_g2_i1:22-309(+)